MNPQFLLAVMLLLVAPTAYGCVNFKAVYDSSQADYLSEGTLWDEGNQVCDTYQGHPEGPDLVFYFHGCPSGFSVAFDGFGETVTYGTDHGTFIFDVTDGSNTYTACEYGCDGSTSGPNQCFVQ